MKLLLTLTVNQNLILAGLTTIGLSLFSFNCGQPIPVLAKQPSSAIVPTLASTFSQFCKHLPSSRLFVKTELFFGLGKPDGSEVTELEFQQFLTHEVTPQFPDGLTLLSGRGQFKDARGQVVKEPANLLILLYPFEQLNNHNQRIEQVRKAYKTIFQQGSVLRTDELICASF